MKSFSRSPFVWISTTVLSAFLYIFAYHFFPQSFPIINLSITMDLEQALDKANELAHEHLLGPSGYDYAAMFHTDTDLKTFVELEAGGNDAFIAMINEQLYMPYTWRVRHFKEYEKNEVIFIFTPDGKPYGFVETLSENLPGSALSLSEAQKIAEEKGTTDWNINFDEYTLIETSQKTEPSKRIDHLFVYERKNKTIGLGLYRLKIIVSGNKITTLTHFVKIPESFCRRYSEMRSANTTIAWAANLIMLLLYILLGCGFGFYWLNKQHWNIIKQPLQWSIFLACLSLLASINQLPFLWMHYQSAFSSNGFLGQLFLGFFINLCIQITSLTIIIMTAEGLTRRAFGFHPQLWLLNKPEIINSYAVLGRTIGGYLLVGFNCAFVIGFYWFSTRYLGWWTPSEMLFNPNVLATYAPWFSSIALSLNAGFMEECLFRAIPLAGAALLGNHFGYKKWWIGIAFILQAIIFGAAHANYPMQPSYARLIELLIPSFIWGITYLYCGLLPTIIAHCTYDIIWLSLPIFISQGTYALGYKIIIIFITLLPLVRILYARIKRGRWNVLSEAARNESWIPSTIIQQPQEPIIEQTETRKINRSTQKLIIISGILGLIAWVYTTPFTHDGITITATRTNAIEVSNEFLQQKNIPVNAPWKTLPLLFTHYNAIASIALQHKFIWKEGKKELYHTLLGTYLEPAHWTVRYAQFTTDIIERAEEYKIMLYNNTLWRFHHQLPEISPGAELTQDEARTIAHTTIQEQFNLNPTELTEISATQEQLPYRRNWLFIFSNPAITLNMGQAQIIVIIAGDQVIDAVRTIHVPETWEREELNKQNILNIITLIFFLILLSCLFIAAALALRKNSMFSFPKPFFFKILGIIQLIFLISIINTWPNIIGSFNTSTPFINQLFQSITSIILSIGIKGIFLAAILTYVLNYKHKTQLLDNLLTLSVGSSIGLFLAGVFAIVRIINPLNMPLWPSYDTLASSISLLAAGITTIMNYIQLTTFFSLLSILIDHRTQHKKRHHLFYMILTILCSMTMINLSLDTLPTWVMTGIILGLIFMGLYRLIIRNNYALISLATGSFSLMPIIQQAFFNAYPGAISEAILNACSLIVVSYLWYYYVKKST